MEQRKSDINTGDGNVINASSNGLNYSFDFSSQVTPEKSGTAPMPGPQPVNQVVAPASQPNVVQTNNVAPMGGTSEPAGPVQTVEPAMPIGPEPVQTAAPTMPVGPEPVQTAEPNAPVGMDSATVTPVSNTDGSALQTTEGVQPEVQTTEAAQNQAEEPIIKDKKSTKTFLFIIVGLIVVFIIALPFIFKIFG